MQPDYADALDDLMKTPSWRIPLSTVNGESSLDCRRVLNKRLTSTNLDSNFESNFDSKSQYPLPNKRMASAQKDEKDKNR